MQECDKFRVHFSSYIEGELLSEERQALEAHLAVCNDCSETIYQIKIIRRSLQALPTITTSRNFEYQLQQRLENLNTSSPWTGPFLNLKRNWKIPAIGSAVASIVIVSVLLLSSPQQQARTPNRTQLRSSVQHTITPPAGITNAAAASAKVLDAASELPSDSVKHERAVPRTSGRPVQLVGD